MIARRKPGTLDGCLARSQSTPTSCPLDFPQPGPQVAAPEADYRPLDAPLVAVPRTQFGPCRGRAEPRPEQGQRRPGALADKRRREDPRRPNRAVRAEELRDPVRGPARRASAAATDRRGHARVRDHRDAARARADRRARGDLASPALAETGAGRGEAAALHRSIDEGDPLARALL